MTSNIKPCRIGILAASSPVPGVELEFGIEKLREEGFGVTVHPGTLARHFIFAGADADRAQAFFDFAHSPEIDMVWCARGGYGATRILPLLEGLTAKHGRPPRKLLAGFSDVTALHEFVRRRWGWGTLHAPMPASGSFLAIPAMQRDAMFAWVRGEAAAESWRQMRLEFLTPPPQRPVEAMLKGGNLTVWTCLTGTPFMPEARGSFLFFEDLNEAWYRIDRMLTQLRQAGAFDGVRGIILGDFTDCKDEAMMVLQSRDSREKVPLRTTFTPDQAMREVFGTLGRELGIPVARGLPVGHGPNFAPLPLGAEYELSADGQFRLVRWDWIGQPRQ